MPLQVTYPAVVVPPLPEKRVSHGWQKLPTDRFDPDFIERRRVGLEVRVCVCGWVCGCLSDVHVQLRVSIAFLDEHS